MSELKQKQLEARKAKKERIQNVMRMPGWKDISAIIQEEFLENLEKLTKADDPSARGAVRVLQRIGERISDDIEWGNAATNEYQKRYFGKLSAEE